MCTLPSIAKVEDLFAAVIHAEERVVAACRGDVSGILECVHEQQRLLAAAMRDKRCVACAEKWLDSMRCPLEVGDWKLAEERGVFPWLTAAQRSIILQQLKCPMGAGLCFAVRDCQPSAN